MNGNESKMRFILFPAISMLLGWGLRGYIGGGPFGAMIPGAMVALSLAMLLKLPARASSVLLVFAVFGIGMGGEMTYGQTLGFLKNPDTVWWGTAGTTLKGAVWGLLGGALFSIGLVFKKIAKRKIFIAIILLIVGMFIGFKLINDPMLLYFSDPQKPRPESWAALLTDALFLLVYLKWKTSAEVFKLVFRFAFYGMIGGALGFGLGGFWMVLGSRLPNVVFTSWWKAMEFTFGFLLGAFLGYAAWLSKKEISALFADDADIFPTPKFAIWKELLVVFIAALLVFWLIPLGMEKFANITIDNNMSGGAVRIEIARLLVNYAVAGLLFVWLLFRFPNTAWQIGITLTFCHGALDLIRDFYPDVSTNSPFTARFLYIFALTAIIAVLAALIQKRKNNVKNMFLLLVISTLVVAFLRLCLNPELFEISGLSFCQLVCGRFFVHLIFLSSALWVARHSFNYSETKKE